MIMCLKFRVDKFEYQEKRMQKLYLLAQQLGHSARTLRAAVIDANNGIAHMVGKSSNNRDTLYVDVDALKRWIAANISTQAHKPVTPTHKVVGARVYLRGVVPKVYGIIRDTRGDGNEREVYVFGDWYAHYDVRLAKGGKE